MTPSGRRPHATGGTDRPVHVLVAEDNVVNQKVARLMLDRAGDGRLLAKPVRREAPQDVLSRWARVEKAEPVA